MRLRMFAPWSLIGILIVLGFLTVSRADMHAADMKLQAQLLWGTDDTKSPNPKHKPVDPDLKKKLKQLPLKWTNYFEETSKSFEVPQASSRRIALSDLCEIEVKNVDGNQ